MDKYNAAIDGLMQFIDDSVFFFFAVYTLNGLLHWAGFTAV